MENKKIMITGAGSGLGKALALWLSQIAAELCLLSRSEKKLQQLQSELQCPSDIHALDFTQATELDRVLVRLLETDFIPDIIIHCSGGGFKKHNPLFTRQNLCQLLDINLSAAVEINSQLIPKMIARKRGVIIHMGSIAGDAAQGSVAYNTVKSALAAYVRSLGRALAGSGVVVTGISPGSFIAEGNNMFHFKNNSPLEFDKFTAALPSKRMSEAKELFSIIKTVCEQQSPLFCGCMLPADAGEGMSYTSSL